MADGPAPRPELTRERQMEVDATSVVTETPRGSEMPLPPEAIFSSDMTFKVIAGNLPLGKGYVLGKSLYFLTGIKKFTNYARRFGFDEIGNCEAVSQENRRGMANVVGWGTLGALIAGPIGAVGLGAMANNKSDWTQLSLTMKDGTRLLIEMKQKDFVRFDFTLKSISPSLPQRE